MSMTKSEHHFQPLPMLCNPEGYTACPIDLSEQSGHLGYWVHLFRSHLSKLLAEAERRFSGELNLKSRLDTARRHFTQYLDSISRQPGQHGRLEIIDICWARERALRAAQFDDVYRDAKCRENDAAMKLWPSLIDELDAMSEAERMSSIIEGVFAGNIFDLGATTTVDLFTDNNVDFISTRQRLSPRPWLIDDLDSFLPKLARGCYRNSLLFVDNAGCDIILGMMPFARELIRRGATVLLAANTEPALNDITHRELVVIVQELSCRDVILRNALDDGRLEMVPSGNDAPLIDLSRVSCQLVQAITRRDIDLVVLEGMGRAIESNFHARLTCDTIKVAMIKDEGVADWLGGSIYDLVFRFEPANGH
ncbi:MAG: hypothetical protein CMJ20_11050 [Phycisphaeraceae bacterium]|nr:hypothetical protein [Phycisphaeraceae bacterium]